MADECEYLRKYGKCPREPNRETCPRAWADTECAATEFPATIWKRTKKSKLRTFAAARAINAKHDHSGRFSVYNPDTKRWATSSSRQVGELLLSKRFVKWPAPQKDIPAAIIPKGSKIDYPGLFLPETMPPAKKLRESSRPWLQFAGWAFGAFILFNFMAR